MKHIMLVVFYCLLITICFQSIAENSDVNPNVESTDRKEIKKNEAVTSESVTQNKVEEKKPEQSLSDLRKEIREISQKINTRRRSLYKENEDIKHLQKEISELQKKVNKVISEDEEYSGLMKSQQTLRESLNKHYKSKRSLDRMSKAGPSRTRLKSRHRPRNIENKNVDQPNLDK